MSAAGRRPAGAVEGDLLTAAASQMSQKASPPIPQPLGMHRREDGIRGDRRVHGVAARAQDREPGLRREMVGRDDGAVPAAGQRHGAHGSERPVTGAATHAGSSPRTDGLPGPPRWCSICRSLESGTRATMSRAPVASRSPSMPAQSATTPPMRLPTDLADGEEDRVEAHDRPAIAWEALADIGQEAHGRRRGAGQDEQAAAKTTATRR